jgi:aminotransferase
MRADYVVRRATMMRVLEQAGFAAVPPEGAYYVMADVTPLGFDDDAAAAMHLVRDKGVAAVPGSSFFSEPELGKHLLRFAFCKRLETLEEAGRRLGG